MIPLRLTAVAANQDMAVMVWIYADQQAKPVNYAELAIPYQDLTFFGLLVVLVVNTPMVPAVALLVWLVVEIAID